MQRKYWLFFWLAAVLLLFFGNGQLLVTDSVESNYALTAKEMVLSNDWLSPQIYGHYWYDKPIMFYWLTAIAFKIFGFTEFAARLFPALFGLAGLGLVCYGGYRLYDEKTGFFSGVLLLSSVEFFLISKSIITDAVLFCFFSASLLFFYLGYKENKAVFWYLMYASAGLAVLTKGPIGILLPGLIITLFLLWQRDWRVLKRCKLFSGVLLCAVIAVPWYAAMYSLHGSDFINTFFGVHNFLRATVSEHPRDNVWYYYLLVNILALFPWSALVPMCLWRRYRQQRPLTEQEKFLLLWAAVVFGFFQCMATKYITYTYPLLFPMSIFLAQELAKEHKPFLTRGYMLFVGVVLASLVGAAFWAENTGLINGESLFVLPLGLIGGILLYIFLQSRRWHVPALAGLSICFYLSLIYSVAVPFSEERSAKGLGKLLVNTGSIEAGVYGSYPTSAVFYSDKVLVKLIHTENISAYRNRDLSWNRKNVMPFADLDASNYSMVIVKDNSLNSFLKNNHKNWLIYACTGKWLLLRQLNRQQNG